MMVTWFTILGEHERIERDLSARAAQALERSGLTWGKVSFKGRDGVLEGMATDDADPGKAADIARNVWGVRIVDNRTSLIDKVDSFVWSASVRDNKIKLGGLVPSEAARKSIHGIVKANFPKFEIEEDGLKLARGAPAQDAWLGGVGFALKQLALLKRGAVSLENLNLSVAGEAESTSAYKSLKAALPGALPQGIKLASEKVTPPAVQPYVWSAKYGANQLLLEGYVPSDKVREDLFAHAKRQFPKVAIIDRMELGDGAPNAFPAAAAATLSELARLDEGRADQKAAQITLSGMAKDEATADAARKGLTANVPSSFKVSESIKAPKPAAPAAITPYTTSARSEAGAIELFGYVPSEAARAELLDVVKARFPGRKIVDKLLVGAGAPDGWQSCLVAGLQSLSRLDEGRIQLSDRHLDLTGVTGDERLVSGAAQQLRSATGGLCEADAKLTLTTAAAPPPPAPPQPAAEPNLQWRAQHSGLGEVVLEGQVPDAAARTAIVQSATSLFGGARIVDRMEIAGGSSARWVKAAEAGLAQLVRLRRGEAVLSGQELVVRGEAPDQDVAATVRAQLGRDVGTGYKARDILEVRDLAAERAAAEAKKAQEEAEAARRKQLADAEAKRKADEAAAAEAKRRADEQAAADAKRKADEAAAAAENAKRKAEADAIMAQRNAEAAKCQDALRKTASEGVIRFERASADLDSKSFATLRALARVAAACPAVRIEIEGHTDAEGTPERNKGLSERRAQAVVAYLVAQGVDAGRLTAIGYGETQPVAPNDTAANRARNRRIEFSVKAQ